MADTDPDGHELINKIKLAYGAKVVNGGRNQRTVN